MPEGYKFRRIPQIVKRPHTASDLKHQATANSERPHTTSNLNRQATSHGERPQTVTSSKSDLNWQATSNIKRPQPARALEPAISKENDFRKRPPPASDFQQRATPSTRRTHMASDLKRPATSMGSNLKERRPVSFDDLLRS
jgi:hypothetical protein